MEIVAPAGNPEKLRYAFAYNADAVYLAGQNFGLRAFADNFTLDEIKSGVQYAKKLGKKVYLTINVFSRNCDLDALPEYLQELSGTSLDAIIVSEPGTLSLVKENTSIPVHLSTQANTTNWLAVQFWKEQGIDRVILAREVTYAEMLQIKDKVPDAELEVFIHGAMCMAWSGRCLMSALLNDRSANQGLCTHPCRWEWNLTEPTRPGQVFTVQEDDRGRYLMHSRDLCLLREIPMLMQSGIAAGKIEGRMKSTYYTALMSRTYSQAKSIQTPQSPVWNTLADEVCKVNHRPYFTGFFYSEDEDKYSSNLPAIDLHQDKDDWQYCGRVLSSEKGIIRFHCLSKIETGDTVQIIFPDRAHDIELKIDKILDDEGNLVTMTKPNRDFGIPVDSANWQWGLVRKLDKSPS